MADYNPQRGSSQTTRRHTRSNGGSTRVVGLPEGLEDSPRHWAGLPYIAVIICASFLALQLWPATHYRHDWDPTRTWHRHPKPGEEVEHVWSTEETSVDSTTEVYHGEERSVGADQKETYTQNAGYIADGLPRLPMKSDAGVPSAENVTDSGLPISLPSASDEGTNWQEIVLSLQKRLQEQEKTLQQNQIKLAALEEHVRDSPKVGG